MANILVICPTFDHGDTLYAAIGSLLAQSVQDWELAVVLDGAPPATHALVEAFTRLDPRIRMYSFPKSQRYGEEHRDAIIRASDAEFVCHLGDDDLYLPDHLAGLRAQLADADWTGRAPLELLDRENIWNPRNFGTPTLRAAMAANRIKGINPGLTNTAYRKSAYLRLPVGWTCAPWEAGASDMYMWAKFFNDPELRVAATSGISVLRFSSRTPQRRGISTQYRTANITPWMAQLARPGLADELRDSAVLFKRMLPLFYLHGTGDSLESTLQRAGLFATPANEAPNVAIDGEPMSLPVNSRQLAELEDARLFIRAFAEDDPASRAAAQTRFEDRPQVWLWAARSLADYRLDADATLRALDAYREAFPDDPQPLRLAVRTLAEEKRLDEAREQFAILQRRWPSHDGLAELAQLLGDTQEAGTADSLVRRLLRKVRTRNA
ncbi:glycosyltransferase [Mangrovimicrobium sediminis]|uniref:Glycosyltransferase n=1 Tax=Mangrovimicrobium sediminis TaxID=2562682 RepID=A0A4Z0M1G5_9GAMM|nr:glycosyltransferase family A protein [Haliea sp. SAOS-164]TGD73381.1 glycosyltransferase [Haliea sp. SAOS-164]